MPVKIEMYENPAANDEKLPSDRSSCWRYPNRARSRISSVFVRDTTSSPRADLRPSLVRHLRAAPASQVDAPFHVAGLAELVLYGPPFHQVIQVLLCEHHEEIPQVLDKPL